jgi:hypothetical protein
MSKINRASGIDDFDQIGPVDAYIAALEWQIRIEEALRTAPVACASRGRPASSRVPTAG